MRSLDLTEIWLELFAVIGVEGGKQAADFFGEACFFKELEVGVCGDDETGWDGDAGVGHFAEIGAFAATVGMSFLVTSLNHTIDLRPARMKCSSLRY